MTERVGLVLCRDVRIYDHGPQHPLRPQRVLLTWDLIAAYGLDRGRQHARAVAPGHSDPGVTGVDA